MASRGVLSNDRVVLLVAGEFPVSIDRVELVSRYLRKTVHRGQSPGAQKNKLQRSHPVTRSSAFLSETLTLSGTERRILVRFSVDAKCWVQGWLCSRSGVGPLVGIAVESLYVPCRAHPITGGPNAGG